MEGRNRTALHTTNLQTPYALTIDYATQTLYWADYALNKLESSNTDGSNRRLLTTNIRDPYFMTFFEGTLYWGDLSYNGIYSALSSSPSSVTSLLYIASDPYGIQVFDKDLQFEGSCASILIVIIVYLLFDNMQFLVPVLKTMATAVICVF